LHEAWDLVDLVDVLPRLGVIPSQREQVTVLHGQVRCDPWHWLRDLRDPEWASVLRAERANVAALRTELEPLIGTIDREIASRCTQEHVTIPSPRGPWEYLTQYPSEVRQPRLLRRPRGGDRGDDEVILDAGREAGGHDYFALGGASVSPDHRFLAYLVDTEGRERYSLTIRDLQTGGSVVSGLGEFAYGVVWDGRSDAVYLTTADPHGRVNRVHRLSMHVGTEPELLFEEHDPAFAVDVSRSKDEACLFVRSASKTTSEVRFLVSAGSPAQLTLIAPRAPGVEYAAEHSRGHLVLVTNRRRPNFEVMAAQLPLNGDDWSVVWQAPWDTRIESLEVFDGFLAVRVRVDGQAGLRVIDLQADVEGLRRRTAVWSVPLPGGPGRLTLAGNLEAGADHVRCQFTSFTSPRTTFLVRPAERSVETLGSDEVPGFLAEDYEASAHQAPAQDGTRIPLSLVRPAGAGAEPRPVILDVYGAYGRCNDPWFSPARLSVLDRDVAYGIAHVRGGGEGGRAWYDAGRRRCKAVSVADYLACAEHLVSAGLTPPGGVVGRGASAGAAVVAAALNAAPELFAGAILEAPFLDCLTSLADETLPLTSLDWEEWGNPLADEGDFHALRAFSPYEGLTQQSYPPVLLTTALADPRVGAWEPFKYAARLRTFDPHCPVYVVVAESGGHFGPTDAAAASNLEALILAFGCHVARARRVSEAGS
jgi:oligopeptidase B